MRIAADIGRLAGVSQSGSPRATRGSGVRVSAIVVVVLLIGGLVAACAAFFVRSVVGATAPLFDAGNAYLTALGQGRTTDAGDRRCDLNALRAAADADRLDAVGWTGAVNLSSATAGTGGYQAEGTIGTRSGDRPVRVELRPDGPDRYCVVVLLVPGAGASEF